MRREVHVRLERHRRRADRELHWPVPGPVDGEISGEEIVEKDPCDDRHDQQDRKRHKRATAARAPWPFRTWRRHRRLGGIVRRWSIWLVWLLCAHGRILSCVRRIHRCALPEQRLPPSVLTPSAYGKW